MSLERILFASRKLQVPHGEGGGETIAFDLLKEVNRKDGCTVQALGAFHYQQVEPLGKTLRDLNVDMELNQQRVDVETTNGKVAYPGFAHIVYQMPGAHTTTLARQDHYHISFQELMRRFSPNLVFLQAEGSVEATQTLRHAGCETFLYVQNGYELQGFANRNVQTPRLLANSRFVQNKIKKLYNVDSSLLYPAIDLSRYQPEKNHAEPTERFTIVFVNPKNVKGLQIFLKLVDHFTDCRFIVQEGWTPLEPPLLRHLSSRPHVECRQRTWNMAQLYAEADLLIVPSQWEEAFGRVVVEAHSCGLPTLASEIGGLPEASGEAGFVVKDFKNPQAWIDEITRLKQNRDELDARSEIMQDNAQRFTPDQAAKTFMDIAACCCC